jgi:hypothetical protein
MVLCENYSIGEYKIAHAFNRDFIRIFFQDITYGRLFKSREEANYTHGKKHAFSVIKFIDEDFMIYNETEGKHYYEMFLDYPEVTNATIHWIQETHPCEDTNNTGYVPLDFTVEMFRGIALSSQKSYAFLDGIPNTDEWWYCVGAMKYHKDLVPGPVVSTNYIGVTSVALWLRINNMSLLQKLPFIRIIRTKALCSQRIDHTIVRLFIIGVLTRK